MSHFRQRGMKGHTGGLTSSECEAMRILSNDGWTQRELQMVFEVQRVDYHLRGDCGHD